MAITMRLFWKMIVKHARRFPRATLGLIWKIMKLLTRNTANFRGSAPQPDQTFSSNTSVEGTMLVRSQINETTPVAFGYRRYGKSTPNFSTTNILILAGHPSKLDLAPEGWQQLSHPEGQPYFYHPQHQIVTENYIIDLDIRRNVEIAYDRLVLNAQELRSMNTASTEFFIDVQVEDGPYYYLIDHNEHTVFWLTNIDSQDLDLAPVYSENHMALQRKSQYWSHVEFFPMHVKYPQESENYLFSVLNQAVLDGVTCSTSTAAYSPKECERFIKILKNFKSKDGYRVWSLARIWKDILQNRFIHLHGQQPARLHRLARLESDIVPQPLPLLPRLFIRILFFDAYQGHIDSLEDIYVDGITYTQHWRSFLEERLREWNAVTIVAAVLWTAGVGLLQVIMGSNSEYYKLIRNLVVSSTFCAMTSTVLSLLHDRQHRRRAKEDDSGKATNYLFRHYHPKRGFLYLAMLYSLPYVLLLWGFLLAAVATFIFGLVSGGEIVVGVTAIVLGVAVIVTVLTWNIEGSVSEHIRETANSVFGHWKTTYLLLLRDATTRWHRSSTSSPREEITAVRETPPAS